MRYWHTRLYSAGVGLLFFLLEVSLGRPIQPMVLFATMSLMGVALTPGGPDTGKPAISGSDGLPDGYWMAREAWIQDGDITDLLQMIDLVE